MSSQSITVPPGQGYRFAEPAAVDPFGVDPFGAGPIVAPAVDGFTRLLGAAVLAGSFMLSWHIFRFGAVNLTFADGAFAVATLLLLSRARLNVLPFGTATPVWYVSLTMMLGGLFISTMVNGDPVRWAIVSSQYFVAYLALPMMLGSLDRRMLDRCLVAYVYGVTFSELCGVVASLTMTYEQSSAMFGNDFLSGTGRIGAFAGNANTNGAMAACALLVLIDVTRRRLLPRWASLVCAFLLLWGLVGCASFTSFAVAVIAFSLTTLITRPARFLLIGLPLLLAGLTYIELELPLPGPFQHRVGEAVASGDVEQAGTFLGRSELVKEAWQLSSRTLVVGFGADGYREVSAMGAPVHMFPLLILTEGGLVALLGLIGLLGVMWWQAVVALRTQGPLAIGVLTVFSGFIFAVPHMYARLWIGPVLLVLVRNCVAMMEEAQQGRDRWPPISGPAWPDGGDGEATEAATEEPGAADRGR